MKALTITILSLALCATAPLAAQDDPPQDKPAERAAPAATQADAKAPAATPAMSPELQAMMAAWEKASTPGPQHKQLAEQFAGDWTTKQTVWLHESMPPINETGKAKSTVVFGGRHVREEFDGQFTGQPFQGAGVTSYDNALGKYVVHWTDSMSTGQFISEGDYDPATKTYTFRGDMADPMKPGTKTSVRTVVRVADNDHHVFEMFETHDGKERKSMRIEYTRVK